MFTLSTLSEGGERFEGVIELNGVDVVSVYSDLYDWHLSTNVALVKCYDGDRVHVVCGTVDNCHLSVFADSGHEFHAVNTFSGVLLSEY